MTIAALGGLGFIGAIVWGVWFLVAIALSSKTMQVNLPMVNLSVVRSEYKPTAR
jgi:hypothetical protein